MNALEVLPKSISSMHFGLVALCTCVALFAGTLGAPSVEAAPTYGCPNGHVCLYQHKNMRTMIWEDQAKWHGCYGLPRRARDQMTSWVNNSRIPMHVMNRHLRWPTYMFTMGVRTNDPWVGHSDNDKADMICALVSPV